MKGGGKRERWMRVRLRRRKYGAARRKQTNTDGDGLTGCQSAELLLEAPPGDGASLSACFVFRELSLLLIRIFRLSFAPSSPPLGSAGR